MGHAIEYRGPDSAGVWTDPQSGIAFSHRRLAIRDLSSAGHQPMVSQSQEWVIIYNGELYQLTDLKKHLENKGHQFKSQSDTEVLLESIAAFGIEETLQQLNGMFAFAAWNIGRRELYLARDRMGIKPLYWSMQNGDFYFASEIKSFFEAPGWEAEQNPEALSSYFKHGYIAAPLSIYQHTYKLEAGSYLKLRAQHEPELKQYWSLAQVTLDGINNPIAENSADTLEQATQLLHGAVGSRMVSDVPIGCFLSGGIDSSTIAALMQAQSSNPIHTFSLGFDVAKFDETHHASAVAKHLGTNHTELMVRGNDALDVIPMLADHHDEPFADMSQIPTYLVSKMARPHVTVALTGDGGDEVFCGYDRFRQIAKVHQLQRYMGKIGQSAIRGSSKFLEKSMIPDILNKIPGPTQSKLHRERWQSVLGAMRETQDTISYREFITFWHNLNEVLVNPAAFDLIDPKWQTMGGREHSLHRLQFIDQKTYLPDDLLSKVDRASMQVSLETRVPLIDHKVVEFGARLPKSLRWNQDGGKVLLRQVLYQYVPREMVDRPKMGFSIPAAEWLQGPLKDWGSDLLSERALKETGEWNIPTIQKRWREHVAGTHRWHYQIWPILFYQAWHKRWYSSAA